MIKNNKNIKNKSYVINKVINIKITLSDFNKFKYVNGLGSSIGFYTISNDNPCILIDNNLDFIKKDMVIYHELLHYIDDLITDDIYHNKRKYFSDQLEMKKIICNKDDDIKLLNKITYMVLNIYPSHRKEIDDRINYEKLSHDLIKSIHYATTKDIDYEYHLSSSEYWVRLNQMRRYLIKNNFLKIDEKLTKNHFILLLKDKNILKKWLSSDIDFFLVLIYTDFDILNKEKTLNDIQIEREINSIL